jgi:hypothetical protein
MPSAFPTSEFLQLTARQVRAYAEEGRPVAITPRLGIRLNLLWRSPPRSVSGKMPAAGLLLLCPCCHHPRRYLLARRQRQENLACRVCWGLSYRSERNRGGARVRQIRKHQRAAERCWQRLKRPPSCSIFGPEALPPRPSGMHRKTNLRLLQKGMKHETAVWGIEEAELAIWGQL